MPTPITSTITLAGQTCLLSVPAGTRADGRATSLTCPLGAAPTRAWVLIERAALANVPEAAPNTLTWSCGGTTIEFPGLYINSRERIKHGGVGDANAVFLVELVDARYIAARQSDSGLIAANHRSYAQTDDDESDRAYLEETRGYSWGDLAAVLWASAGLLGAFPGLPFEPDWRPEMQRFAGTSGYRALCEFLDFLDCAICHNPTTGVYTIVALGAEQPLPDRSTRLKWDGEPKNFPTSAAAYVNSYFPTHFRAYGQENDTPQEGNWAATRYADQRPFPTNIEGALGAIPRWQDMPRVYDIDDADANLARRLARAQNVTSRYAQRASVPREHKVYLGLINDILPGARVRAVQWRHFGNTHGTETEYFSGPNLPNDIGGAAADLSTVCDLQPGENYAAPDLSRRSYPNYPRLPNIVQINHDGETAGTTVDANADGFHKSRVRRWVGGEMTTIEDCWVLFVDDFDNAEGDVSAKQGEYYGPARLSGFADSEGEELPLYLVRKGGDDSLIFFELYEDLDLGQSALAYVLSADGDGWAAPVNGVTPQVTVQDPYNEGMWQGLAGYRGFARKHPAGDRYDIVFMEEIARWVFYELDEDLPSDGTGADATVLTYHDGKNPGANIEVFEPPVGMIYFRKYHIDGCQGWAHWNDFQKRYEVTVPQLVVKFMRGKLYSPLCSSGDEPRVKTDATLVGLKQGYYSFMPNFDAETPLVCVNPRGHRGPINAAVLLMSRAVDAGLEWEIVDMELFEVNPITAISFNSQTCAFQTTNTKIFVESCMETGSDTLSSFTAKNIVTDISHTSGTETIDGVPTPFCRTTKTTQTFCLLPKTNELGETDETTTTVVEYTAQPTLTDVDTNVDETYLVGDVAVVWSACTPTTDTVNLIPLATCESGPSAVDGGTY